MNFSIASYDWNSLSHVLVTVNVSSDFKSLYIAGAEEATQKWGGGINQSSKNMQ